MAERAGTRTRSRAALSRDLVLRTAVDLADGGGIAALTMRRLAQELGVEAMSLYHHVADKEQLLDGIADVVVREVNDRLDETAAPPEGAGWKATVRQRILTAREVLLTHPWMPAVLESRKNFSPAVLDYFNAMIGQMLAGGLSGDLVHHATHVLGSRALGFTQELFDLQGNGDSDAGADEAMLRQLAAQYPNITAMIATASHDADSTLGWCDDQFEFEFGLDLLLDGLERLHARERH